MFTALLCLACLAIGWLAPKFWPRLLPKSDRGVHALGVPRSPAWRRVRATHLEAQPLCAICGSEVNLAVHHKKSFHENPEMELEPNNLVTLCENSNLNCHFVFGHKMNWRKINEDIDRHIKLMNGLLQDD